MEGRLTTPEQFGNIILKSASNGQFVYLKDVAKIETGTQNASSNSKINGKNGIGFGVQLTNDANALDTISQVKQVLNEAKETSRLIWTTSSSWIIPASSMLPSAK